MAFSSCGMFVIAGSLLCTAHSGCNQRRVDQMAGPEVAAEDPDHSCSSWLAAERRRRSRDLAEGTGWRLEQACCQGNRAWASVDLACNSVGLLHTVDCNCLEVMVVVVGCMVIGLHVRGNTERGQSQECNSKESSP